VRKEFLISRVERKQEMHCGCTSQAAQCEKGLELLAEKQRAWGAWIPVSGTYRADYGFRQDYQAAKVAYDEHVRQAEERLEDAAQE
jgi:hypothetical protein